MATFINTKSPATIEDICKFEKDNQITLPDDYKEFLLKYNGGQPCPSS
ncbi:SMI1/KNR4 family protein, partial [Salmonella enterica]|nr:SMI1/KNR4 family protein [Salmonella enterica]